MRNTLFAAAAFGLLTAASAFTLSGEGVKMLADGGDFVVTNQQAADGGDFVVTNQQTADGGDFVVTNQQTADGGDFVVTNSPA